MLRLGGYEGDGRGGLRSEPGEKEKRTEGATFPGMSVACISGEKIRNPRERDRSDWNARSRVWPRKISSRHPVPVPLSHPSLSLPLYLSPSSIPHAHPPPTHSFPRLSLLSPPSPPPPPPSPAMYRIRTWVGHRHKGKPQHKSVVRGGTSTSQPKEPKVDVEATATATGPCHVDLGSGDVSPLNSTSHDGDVSTCNDDAITGRYLLRLAPPYNRQNSFPGPYHSIVVPLMLISLSPIFQASTQVI